MMNQFHADSQKELVKSVRNIQIEQRGMRHISELLKERERLLKASTDERRKEILRRINERRRLVFEAPGNEWQIYELCKDVYHLAELDRVNFNGASYAEKHMFIRQIASFVETEVLALGVREYHDSRERQNWQMHYLQDDENDSRDEAIPAFQSVMFSFIRHKGLTAEYEAYAANYELSNESR